MKQLCNKLKIIKNQNDIDVNRLMTYIFEWYNDETLILQEIRKIDIDHYNQPIENYNIDDMVQHKKHCCFEIDEITVEE